MNKILFPGLNLEFNVSRIALQIGSLSIYWYAICIVLGIVISLILMRISKNRFNIEYEDFLEIFVVTLILGIIGARIYYVIFNFSYYFQNVGQIFNLRSGGLAIYGGIIVGIIVIIILCKKKSINCLDFFDYISPYLALAQAIGRWGNFFNVEAYGVETKNIFRMGLEVSGKYIEVHPTFLYESIANVIIFLILRFMQRKRRFGGQILSLYLIFYGIIRFFIEGVRSDSLMFFNFRISQIVSIVFVVVGVIIYKRKSKIHNVENNRML